MTRDARLTVSLLSVLALAVPALADPAEDAFYRGVELQRQGRYWEAIAEYEASIRYDPSSYEPHTNRALCYLSLQEYQRALEAVEAGMRAGDWSAVAYSTRGQAYSGLGRYQEALNDYNRAIELDPNDGLYYDQRAFAYIQLGRDDLARPDLDRAIRLDPSNQTSRLRRGGMRLGEDDYAGALEDAEAAIRAGGPKTPDALVLRGAARLGLGRSAEAAADYREALRLDPSNTLAQAALAILGEGTSGAASIADLERRTAGADAGNDEVWGDLGDAYRAAGRTDDARRAYRRALDLDPADGEWQSKLRDLGDGAYVAEAMGRLIPELKRRVAGADARNDEVWGDLGDAYRAAGRTADALFAYRRALELDPADSEWPGKIRELEGGAPAAPAPSPTPPPATTTGGSIADLERRTAGADAGNDEVWGDLGDAYRAAGRTDDARRAYRRALGLDPADGEWSGKLRDLGDEGFVEGIATARIADLERRTAGADAGNDEVWGDLGDAYKAAGRTADAVRAWRRALDLDPADGEWQGKLREHGEGAYVEAAFRRLIPDLERRTAGADAGNDEVWGDLGDAYRAAGRTADAIRAYRRANELDPADSEWTRKLGELGAR